MMKKLFLTIFLLPSVLLAQVQGTAAGQGERGSQFLGVVVPNCATSVNGAAGTWGRFAVDVNGNICTLAAIDTTGLATDTGQNTMITSLQLLDDVVATDGAAVLAKSFQVAGTDGTNAQTISVTTTGAVVVSDGSGALNTIVDSSALPTGAATEASLVTITGHLDGVEGLLTTMDADTGTIAGAVAGTEMQVDVVASLPAGTNNIGDVDILSVIPGTGATNLGKAEDSAFSNLDTGVGSVGVRTDTPASSAATGDYEFIKLNSLGAQWVAEVDRSLWDYTTGVSTETEAIAAPGAGNSICIDFIYAKTPTTVNPATVKVEFGDVTVFNIQIPTATVGTVPNHPQVYLSFPKCLMVGDNASVELTPNDTGVETTIGYSTRKTY